LSAALRYLLHFPDGSEYGPIDRATFEAWHREGRIPPEALVWPEGSPQWLTVEGALATAEPPTPPPEPGVAAPPAAERSPSGAMARVPGPDDTKPPRRAPRRPRRARERVTPSPLVRRVLLLAAGLGVVAVVVGGLLALLQPVLERRQAVAAIRRHALAERRLVDSDSGLAVDLPSGWVALREGNPYVTAAARMRLAQPSVPAFGVLRSELRPELMGDLDRHLDELLRERVPTRASQRETGRADLQLGRGQARLVRTSWEDGLDPMQGALLSWADGYRYFSLDTWAPGGATGFAAAVEAVARGILPSGAEEARVGEALQRLALEVPELSPPALRLLIEERLSRGETVDSVPLDALRAVSRGLVALSPTEAEEMGRIYEQIWAPVPEGERVRYARLLQYARRGRALPVEEAQALRAVMKAGTLALPEDQLARLRALSEKAVRGSTELP
jgi:hypothetical protein